MKRVAHQCIIMQYIMELAKSVKQDPRVCVPGFFKRCEGTRVLLLCLSADCRRMATADKEYTDAFKEELANFLVRVQGRAQARLDKAREEAEEEARHEREARQLTPIESI